MLHQLPVVSLCQINKGQITEVVASLTLFFLLLNQSCMLMLIIKQRVTFSQIQGKYNSNLAYQEKLAHGMEIHHHVCLKERSWTTKQTPTVVLYSHFSFNFQP